MIEANLLLDDVSQACQTVRTARPRARTSEQRQALDRYARDLSC